MAKMQIPGSEVRLDPDGITKLEISGKNNPHTSIEIFLKDNENPMVLEFSNRKKAIEFYKTVWQLRESNDEELVEVGDFS